jgi:hypothetical protein
MQNFLIFVPTIKYMLIFKRLSSCFLVWWPQVELVIFVNVSHPALG